MGRVAKGLRHWVADLDLILTSPLTRAQQTAEILARRYDGLKTATSAALVPARSRPNCSNICAPWATGRWPWSATSRT